MYTVINALLCFPRNLSCVMGKVSVFELPPKVLRVTTFLVKTGSPSSSAYSFVMYDVFEPLSKNILAVTDLPGLVACSIFPFSIPKMTLLSFPTDAPRVVDSQACFS